jgi:hypothetical protein
MGAPTANPVGDHQHDDGPDDRLDDRAKQPDREDAP